MTTPSTPRPPRGGIGAGLGALIPAAPVPALSRRGSRADMPSPAARIAAEAEEVAAAVAALALPAGRPDVPWDLPATTTAWLRSRRSAHTRRAYFRDLSHFLSWLDVIGLDPRQVTRPDLDSYLASLRASTPQPSPATLNRRLATLSSWYGYLVDADVAARNPVTTVDREPLDRDFSPTVGLTVAEVRALLRAADDVLATRNNRQNQTTWNTWLIAAAERDRLLVGLLTYLGLRVGEATALRCEDLRHDAGHRTVVIRGKGGRRRQLPLPPALVRLLDPFLTERRRAADQAAAEQHYADKLQEATKIYERQGYARVDAHRRAERAIAPHRSRELARITNASPEELATVRLTGLLLHTNTNQPLTQAAVFATVRRLARAAGLPAAEKISPHSLRHAAATAALDDGVPLRDVQDFLGHADPRTTRRYDRNRGSLDRSPVHRLAVLYAQ